MENTKQLKFIMSQKVQGTDQISVALASARSTILALAGSTLSAPNGFVLSIEFRVNPSTDS